MPRNLNGTRLDKWLWATRLFKTRSQANEACKGGKVKIDGANVKPAREVKAGETITIRKDGLVSTVKVLDTFDKRVGAKLVTNYLEDLTPEEVRSAARERRHAMPSGKRPSGLGRPTKRQRRALEEFFEDADT